MPRVDRPGSGLGTRDSRLGGTRDSGLDRGTAEAYAERLLWHFGEDEDDLDEDLLNEEDEDLDDLDDLIDEEFGTDEDLGDDPDEDDDTTGFGGVRAWPSRVREADRRRTEIEEFFGGREERQQKREERQERQLRQLEIAERQQALAGRGFLSAGAGLAAALGQGIIGSGYNPWAPQPPIVLQPPAPAVPPTEAPTAAPEVVADRQTLPPVYVSDATLAAEVEEAEKVESPATMVPTTKFGASFHEGSVRPRRGRSREAILLARFGAEKELREALPEAPVPLVEDAGAAPVLLDDGRVVEPTHGRLCLISCFSCSGLPASHYGTTGNGCVVCDDYGAILVPSSDVRPVAGTDSFGFVGAIISAAAQLATTGAEIGAGAIGARKQSRAMEASARAQKVYEKLLAKVKPKEVAPQPEAAEQPSAVSSQPSAVSQEQVSGLGGWLGGLDDLEDLDVEEEFGLDEDVGDDDEDFGIDDDLDEDDLDEGDLDEEEDGEDDDLDFLDEDDPFPEEEDDLDDLRPEGRIVRVLFPRGRE